MNKNLYRIVFNRARGLLMVVGELAASRDKSAGPMRACRAGSRRVRTALSALTFAVWGALGMVLWVSSPAQAQIVADPGAAATQRPTILNAGNGVPQVNIQTPSAAGVSRNLYIQFDVNQQGAILNNSRTATQTQLGGWVQPNPWLATGGARVILNEVNSSNPSQLRGYVEVAGTRAQVVIANPAGITCDGCGFINSNRATLTTGTPIVNGGNLEGYLVQRGMVTIQGAGLDASRTDYTDIIARSVQVNAGIWAQDLKVLAGANEVRGDQLQATVIAGTGPAPAFAVDVAQLGGMYAGKITLVGTETGVGVRNAGQIGASAGEVIVTVDGRLENSGRITSTARMQIDTQGGVVNPGLLASEGDISVHAASFNNTGGQVQALGDATIGVGNGAVDNTASLIRSGKTLSIAASSVANANTQGADQGLEGLSIDVAASRIDNASGAMRASAALTLTGSGTLDNTQGLISSGQSLTVRDADLSVKTLAITNTGGTLIAGQTLTVDSARLTGDGHLLSLGDLSVKLIGDYTHTGEFQANGAATLETAGTLTNHSALLAGDTLTLKAAVIDNRASGEISAYTLLLGGAGSQTLTNRGLIDGQETLIETQTLNNLGTGRIYGDHVAIGATTLTNAPENGVAPVIAARYRLDLGVQTLNNSEHALIFSAGDLAIGGSLDANRLATGQATTVNNNSATIEALGDLDLNAQQVANTNEHFSTQVVETGRASVQEFQNTGSPNRWLGSQVTVFNDEVDFLSSPDGTGDNWNRYDYTRVTTETQILSSDPGQILSGGAMRISANGVLNDKSRIVAGGTLTGIIGSLTNTEVAGERTTTDSGSYLNFFRIQKKGRDNQGTGFNSYTPAPTIEAISLRPSAYQQSTAPGGTGTQIATLATSSVNGTIRIAALLNSSLFRQNPDASAAYLIEIDPRFASYRTWLSSDYMLQQLSLDPATTLKRLGDGFYEQKLVREQVAQLTGRRFLDGYASDEAEYRALIDNAVTYARQWSLRPGIALSAEQIAQLTSDIVWLVEKEVTLPDGRLTKALVPQLYVRLQDSDLDGSGALISGNSVELNVNGDLVNSGSIAGRRVVSLTAENLKNLGGRISGEDVAARVRLDLDNLGGTIQGTDSVLAIAGRDLNIVSTTRDSESAQGSRTSLERVAGLYVSNPGGTLVAMAGRDANLVAASLVNSGAGGTTVIAAGNDLNLGTVTESSRQAIVVDANNSRKDASRAEIGTRIEASGDITLSAGNDLNARAANVTSELGALAATAAGNVNLTAGESSRSVDEGHQTTGSSGAYSKKTTATRDTFDETLAQGTTFSANTTTIQAGSNAAAGDINIRGSNVISTGSTTLSAAGSINVEAATNTLAETHFKDEKTSGLFSSGGVGFTVGMQQQSSGNKSTNTTAAASTVGSTEGNVGIEAGNGYRQTGSLVLAPQGDIDIRAQKVDIVEAQNTGRSEQETKFKQVGVTVAVTSPLISAIQTAQQMKSASEHTDDSRMQVLAGATTGLAAKNAYDAVAQNPTQVGGINVSVSLGASKNQSNSTQTSSTVAGSTVAAGGKVNIQAAGAGAQSDITVQGSQIKAGTDASLKAEGDLNLLAGKNDSEQHSTNKSSSGSIGVGFGTNGLTVNLSASLSRGNADGQDVTWTNARVEAGNTLALESGGDTNLKGAVASGRQVQAEVGGNLNIESLQDTSVFKSKEVSMGFSVSIPIGAGVAGGSINASKSQSESSFATVTEQSGIKAGDAGFQINVRGNTDLKGALIASSDKAVQEQSNSLTTGTLTQSNIENKAEYKAQSVGLGLGYGQNVGQDQQGRAQAGPEQTPGSTLPSAGGFSATPPIALNASDSASSTSRSGISGAAIRITDDQKQQERTGQSAEQTLASINRDVSTDKDTSNALKPIFDEQEIKARFAIVSAFTREAGSFLENRAKEADIMKAQADKADVLARDLNNALSDGERQSQRDQAVVLRAEAQNISDNWGAGGTYRQITTALVAAAGGNVSAASTEFAQNLVVNYAQQQGAAYIGKLVHEGALEEGSAVHAALHAIVGCAGAAASNQSCGAGAMGAATASLLTNLFTDDPRESATQKEAKKNLINTLVAGIASTNGGQDVVTALNASNAATENNFLSPKQEQKRQAALKSGNHAELAKWNATDTKQQTVADGLQQARDAYDLAKTPEEKKAALGKLNESVAAADNLYQSLKQEGDGGGKYFAYNILASYTVKAEACANAGQTCVLLPAERQQLAGFYSDLGMTVGMMEEPVGGAVARAGTKALEKMLGIAETLGSVAGILKEATQTAAASVQRVVGAAADFPVSTAAQSEARAVSAPASSAAPSAPKAGTGLGAADNNYSSMRPMEEVFPELKGVNGHYVDNAVPGVNTNCASCANAAQQRLTGQNPSAVAEPSQGYSVPNDLLPSAPFGLQEITTPSAIQGLMAKAGNGAVGVVVINRPGELQHVINVVNRNGTVYFVDTQLGKIVTLKPDVPVMLGRP